MKPPIVFLITMLLSSSYAFVFPDGYEALYKYSAKVMAYMIGEENTSKYEIFADILFYKSDTIVQMRLENVTYSAYTGRPTKNGDRVEPSERITKTILLPFFFVMENGRYAMKVHKSDEQWSVDMKKSIAHMFDVNESVLELSSNKVHHEKETVIGDSKECPIEYKVIKGHNEYSVWKEFGLNHCFRPHVELNFTPKMECNTPEDFNNVVKHYSIKNGSNGLVMDSVLSEGIYQSFYSKFSVNIEQHIVMKSIDEKTNRLIDSDYVDVSSIPKSTINMENNMNKVKKTLEILVDYVSTMEIKLTEAVHEQEEGFASLLDHMKGLNYKHFLKLFEEISQTTKAKSMNELFVQTLPFVGTKDSNRAIRHFVMNKSVDDNMAVHLLQNMYGMKVQMENPYVKELEDLTEKDSGLSESVQTAAILGFSSTIGDLEASFSQNASIEFDERIIALANKLTEAKTYKDKLVLINAIGNVQYMQILPTLNKIISGKEPFADLDPHLRAVAMLSNLQSPRGISDIFNVVQIQDECMYHFKNKNEHLELRLAALQVMMARGKPRMWIELYWHILKEDNNEIRSLFYTYMKNRAESKIECYENHVGFAKQLLKMCKSFPAGKTSSLGEIYEFVDSSQNMGSGMNLIAYGDLNKDKFHTIYIEKVFIYMESVFSVESIYIHFKLKYDENVELNLEMFAKIPQDVLSVEVITYKNNVATFVDILNPKYVFKTFTDWWKDVDQKNALLISRHYYFKEETLGDHGFPVRTYMSSSTLRRSKSNEIESFLIDFKQSEDMEYGIAVKNPLLDVWHGIRRVQKVDMVIDLKLGFESLLPFDKFDLTWNSVNNDSRTSGFESVGHTEVFVTGEGSEEVLRSSCADCKKNMDTGSRNRKNYTIWEYDDEFTGLFYHLKIFDCDEIGIQQYKSHLREIFMENLRNLNLKTIYSAISNCWYYMTLMTPEKTCGIGFSVQPSQQHRTNKVVIASEHSSEKLRLLIDIMSDESHLKTWRISSETMFSPEMNTFEAVVYGVDWKTKKKEALDVTFSRFFRNESAFLKILHKHVTPEDSEPLTFSTIFEVDLEGHGNGEDGHDLYYECDWSIAYLNYLCKMNMADLKKYKYDVKIEDLGGIWKKIYNMLKDMFVAVD